MPGIDEKETEFQVRLKDPSLFKDSTDSWGQTELAEGVQLVVGTLIESGKKEAQSLRFSKDKFSDSDAVEKWLADEWKADAPIAGSVSIAWQANGPASVIEDVTGFNVPEGEMLVKATVLGPGELQGWDFTPDMVQPERWVGKPFLKFHTEISHNGSTLHIDNPLALDTRIQDARLNDAGEMDIYHTIKDKALQDLAAAGDLYESIQGWPEFDSSGRFIGIEPRGVAATLEPAYPKDKSRSRPLACSAVEALHITFTAGASSDPPVTADGDDLMTEDNKVKELESRTAALEKENADLKKQLGETEKADVEALTEKVTKAEAELAEAKKALEDHSTELEAYRQKEKEALAEETLEIEKDLAEEEMDEEATKTRLAELTEMESPVLKKHAVAVTAQAMRAYKEALQKDPAPGERRSAIGASRSGGKPEHEKLYEDGKEIFDKFDLTDKELDPAWSADKPDGGDA